MRKQKGIEDIIHEDKEGRFFIKLSKKFFEKDAILFAADTFTDRCIIYINPVDNDCVGVTFKKKANLPIDVSIIIDEFCNCVLNRQVRLDIEKKYGGIRDLIVEHAFKPIHDLKIALKKAEM